KAMTKSGPKSDARILMCRIPSQSVASAKKKIVGFERDAPGAGAETREHGRSSVKGSGGGFDGNFGGRRPRGAKRAGRITQVRLPGSEAARQQAKPRSGRVRFGGAVGTSSRRAIGVRDATGSVEVHPSIGSRRPRSRSQRQQQERRRTRRPGQRISGE